MEFVPRSAVGVAPDGFLDDVEKCVDVGLVNAKGDRVAHSNEGNESGWSESTGGREQTWGEDELGFIRKVFFWRVGDIEVSDGEGFRRHSRGPFMVGGPVCPACE